MKAFSTPLLILALSLPAPAIAELYRWTDANGTLRITENLANVPPQHRSQIADASRTSRKLQRYASAKTRPTHVAALSISSIGPSSPGQEILVPFEREGNLMKVMVRLNDSVVAPFYVDTGASDISIPRSVGTQLGVTTGSTGVATEITANGAIQVPVITLDSVQLGNARVEKLLATVNPMLEVGLLGGSFFNRFSYSVNTAEGVISLRPN